MELSGNLTAPIRKSITLAKSSYFNKLNETCKIMTYRGVLRKKTLVCKFYTVSTFVRNITNVRGGGGITQTQTIIQIHDCYACYTIFKTCLN
jgi:hypothetical protein